MYFTLKPYKRIYSTSCQSIYAQIIVRILLNDFMMKSIIWKSILTYKECQINVRSLFYSQLISRHVASTRNQLNLVSKGSILKRQFKIIAAFCCIDLFDFKVVRDLYISNADNVTFSIALFNCSIILPKLISINLYYVVLPQKNLLASQVHQSIRLQV